ncbi:MAG: hypothetical protein ISS69_16270 [Phycisphaerae bacterium]|nr:hypothetical protein [Phycisphaerae bacterium]
MTSIPTWVYPYFATAGIAGLAISVALVLRKHAPVAFRVLIVIAIAMVGITGYGIFTSPEPYRLDVRPASFDTIFTGPEKGKALVITNNDVRPATIISVTINDEFTVTKLLDSTPRGEPADFPITLGPGDTLKLVICDAHPAMRVLSAFNKSFTNNSVIPETQRSEEKDVGNDQDYTKELVLVTIQTDLGSVRLAP